MREREREKGKERKKGYGRAEGNQTLAHSGYADWQKKDCQDTEKKGGDKKEEERERGRESETGRKRSSKRVNMSPSDITYPEHCLKQPWHRGWARGRLRERESERMKGYYTFFITFPGAKPLQRLAEGERGRERERRVGTGCSN